MLVIRKMEGVQERANLVKQRESGTNCDNLDMLM